MRPELHNPVATSRFQQLLPLVETVFHLHETGCKYEDELRQISRLLGRVVGQIDVLGAFGSISAGDFASQLAIDWHAIPTDLSEPELLELLEAICEVRGSQAVLNYWVRCLAVNTGDDRISDLIFWPEQYLGPEYDGRDLPPTEMLEVALRKRRTKESKS